MNKDIENIKEQLEEVIKKNLPEERTQDNLPFENSPEIYGNQRIEAYKNGFNQAISQIDTSLIADEVLRVFEEEKYGLLKKYSQWLEKHKYIDCDWWAEEPGSVDRFLEEFNPLSTNKENENNG